ncbi:MAG: hypothetical protein JKY60_11625 [Kordiimonadaceae bacterium]|nr:hypothetical protein [Kordiimonadaceae bacterium]
MKKLWLIVAAFSFSVDAQGPQYKDQFPKGVYITNSSQGHWLALMDEGKYLLCSPRKCEEGKYSIVSSSHAAIHDFYKTELGLEIEKESTEAAAALKSLRESIPDRTFDLPFTIGICDSVPCVGLGRKLDGITFRLALPFP